MNMTIPIEIGIPAAAMILVALIGWFSQWVLKGRPSVSDIWSRLGQVEARLDEAESREQAALIDSAKARAETAEIKAIIRPWFRDLLDWDRRGRIGDIPLPDRAHLQKLGIEENRKVTEEK